MINPNKLFLPYINLIAIISILIFLIAANFSHSEKIVTVDNNKLFDGFAMTKEVRRAAEKEFNSKKLSLETLYTRLQSTTISEAEKKPLMLQFVQQKEALEKFNQDFAAEKSSLIWSRVKGYVREFSKEKNYKIVMGSEDSGTVLFADESIDVTNELLIYINKKYEGNK